MDTTVKEKALEIKYIHKIMMKIMQLILKMLIELKKTKKIQEVDLLDKTEKKVFTKKIFN